jgi:hypothetical protein
MRRKDMSRDIIIDILWRLAYRRASKLAEQGRRDEAMILLARCKKLR